MIDDSNSNIRTSLDAQVEVLVGGLHYDVTIYTERVAAGDPFDMEVHFKNGNNEIVISANHVVNLSVVDATNLNEVEGSLQFVSVNLQNGKRLKSRETCWLINFDTFLKRMISRVCSTGEPFSRDWKMRLTEQ